MDPSHWSQTLPPCVHLYPLICKERQRVQVPHSGTSYYLGSGKTCPVREVPNGKGTIRVHVPFTWNSLAQGKQRVGFLGGSVAKKSVSQCRRHGFNPWVRKIPWRREWQSTPVFLPGKSHGQRNLAGYTPPGRKDSDITEQQDRQTCSWKTVLAQKLGNVPYATGYFPILNSGAHRSSSCLQAVAITTLLAEVNKLTFGQPLEFQTPHQVWEILEIKGHHWIVHDILWSTKLWSLTSQSFPYPQNLLYPQLGYTLFVVQCLSPVCGFVTP